MDTKMDRKRQLCQGWIWTRNNIFLYVLIKMLRLWGLEYLLIILKGPNSAHCRQWSPAWAPVQQQSWKISIKLVRHSKFILYFVWGQTLSLPQQSPSPVTVPDQVLTLMWYYCLAEKHPQWIVLVLDKAFIFLKTSALNASHQTACS